MCARALTHCVSTRSFEYACYNHRGWDLGNHFCEHTGFDLDWTKFPSREKQMFFLTRYATHRPCTAMTRHARSVDQAVRS